MTMCHFVLFFFCWFSTETNRNNFLVQRQPKVVTATDEADLARRMERAEAENAEIDGDEDEEEEEGMKFDGEGDEEDDAVAGSDDETNAEK